MWIVVVVDSYYPSVFHFDDEVEAKKAYEKYKNHRIVTHFAKVEDYCFDEEITEDFSNIKLDDVKTWDVDWS